MLIRDSCKNRFSKGCGMKREMEKKAPLALNLSRRKVLGLIGASAAASLVAGAGEYSAASARQTSAPTQNLKGRMVTFDAKLEPVTIDTAKTAVMVVDMQNDFGTKGGMFDRVGIDISMIQRAVGPTAKVLAAARRADIKIVYLKWAIIPIFRTSGVRPLPTACGTCWRVSERPFVPLTVRKAEF
jgi:hypothetical protein